MSEKCPVIHKVTDTGGPSKCPVDVKANTSDVNIPSPDSIDAIETPSIKEYRSLKRVMGSITQFYLSGSEKKAKNYEAMIGHLKAIDEDLDMVKAQLEALVSDRYNGHPKQQQYREILTSELESLQLKRKDMQERTDEFLELRDWSKVINEVCCWLEANFDYYALQNIVGLEKKLANVTPPEPLDDATTKIYSRGLDEISYNLEESQDFFQAAIDGRLQLFHEIEAEIIQAQIDVLAKFPENNARRIALTEDLEMDLNYVELNDDSSKEALHRKKKMLANHQAYLKVLKFHTDKLGALTDLPPKAQREYDPKYTFVAKLPVTVQQELSNIEDK